MKPIYKRVKKVVPYCPVCKVELFGDGSIVSPYRCECGTWRIDWKNMDYQIVKNSGEEEGNIKN